MGVREIYSTSDTVIGQQHCIFGESNRNYAVKNFLRHADSIFCRNFFMVGAYKL